MENRNKKIFLIASITVPFLLYSGYYYGVMIKNAPYKFVELDHISIQYGNRDSMLNMYNSKTANYQFLTKRNTLVKTKLHLRNDDLLYLHRKAADLGFWDFPSKELGDTTEKAPRYIIEFGYKRKTKRVIFDANFAGNPKLKDANERLIKEILSVVNTAQDKAKK